VSGVQIVSEYRVARTGEAGDLHTRLPSPSQINETDVAVNKQVDLYN